MRWSYSLNAQHAQTRHLESTSVWRISVPISKNIAASIVWVQRVFMIMLPKRHKLSLMTSWQNTERSGLPSERAWSNWLLQPSLGSPRMSSFSDISRASPSTKKKEKSPNLNKIKGRGSHMTTTIWWSLSPTSRLTPPRPSANTSSIRKRMNCCLRWTTTWSNASVSNPSNTSKISTSKWSMRSMR